MYTKLKVQIRN